MCEGATQARKPNRNHNDFEGKGEVGRRGRERLAEGQLRDEDAEDQARDHNEGLVPPRTGGGFLGEDEGVDDEHDEVEQHDEDNEDLHT